MCSCFIFANNLHVCCVRRSSEGRRNGLAVCVLSPETACSLPAIPTCYFSFGRPCDTWKSHFPQKIACCKRRLHAKVDKFTNVKIRSRPESLKEVTVRQCIGDAKKTLDGIKGPTGFDHGRPNSKFGKFNANTSAVSSGYKPPLHPRK